MSNAYYAQLWLDARKDLEKLIEIDQTVLDGKPIENVEIAVNKVLELYYRYRRIIQRLTDSHDQLVQPQIRELVGKMLDYSIVRMLEYRREVVNLIFVEYPWPTDILLNLKLTPDDIDLTTPVYNSWANKAEFERMKKLAEDFIENAKMQGNVAESDDVSDLTSNATPPALISIQESESSPPTSLVSTRSRRTRPSMAPSQEFIPPVDPETPEERAQREAEEAEKKAYNDKILLIQSHERARVGRNIALAAVRRREFDKKLASGELTLREASASERAQAAVVIQKTWRGFLARRRMKEKIIQTEEAVGMIIPSWTSRDIYKRYQENFEERLQMQVEAEKHVQDVTKAQKERIWEFHGPRVVEDIRDEIYQWFLMWYNELGYFDHIPEDKDGGSLLISTGQVRTPQEYIIELLKGNEKKKKTAEPPPQDDDDEDAADEEDPGWEMPESTTLPLLIEANKEFLENWSLRTEQILDPKGGVIVDLVKDKLCHELQLEMRPTADKTMRPALDKLNQALKADNVGNQAFFLPDPQQFETAASENGGDGGKKRRASAEKPDPLAAIPTDELLAQLIRWKVVGGELEECRLSEWPGVTSYEVSAMLGNREPVRMGDAKSAVMDYCVLPLLSRSVSELAPPVRSVCICGPPNSGQLFIARAICMELKATVFDLTPEKHVGRFAHKQSQERLVQTVLKLAKRFAPSVVLVDGAEKPWLKRLPPEMRRVKPQKFASVYPKIVKGIKPGDQVLFLTTSSWPYMAGRPFIRLHDKFIVLPVADYPTMHLAFLKRLASHPAVDRRFDVSAVARVLQGRVPMESALAGLADCVSIRRRMKFRRQPLRREEILERVMETNPLDAQQLDKFCKFRDGMSLAKKRRAFEEENQPEEPKDAKKKK